MPIDIVPVNGTREVETVVALAEAVWTQHFIPIVGAAQVAYMLEKFQSASAIRGQIESGVEYYTAFQNDEPVGYFALVPDREQRRMMISKIYVAGPARGTGCGKEMLRFIENRARKSDIVALWLTVNRFNHSSVEWYKRRGFQIIDEVKTDIGGGFFMDDFIFEKPLLRSDKSRG